MLAPRFLPGGCLGVIERPLFTGQRWDATIGLYDYAAPDGAVARFYDPEVGQGSLSKVEGFTQPDSLIPEPGNPIAWNRYAYVYNSPFNYTDPSGHSALALALGTLAVVDAVWDGADFLGYARDCFGNNSSLACSAMAGAGLMMAIPGDGLGDNAGRRAVRRTKDVGNGQRNIYLYAFRGTGRTAEEFIGSEPLIYAGHGALSLDQESILGFTPYTSKGGEEAISALKRHESFPGQVSNDTAIFHRAQDLVEQGYRTQVYVLPIAVSENDFARIRNQIMDDLGNSPMAYKRYAFPGVPGCFNCVTWPSTLDLKLPDSSGSMNKLVPAMIQAGAKPWRR